MKTVYKIKAIELSDELNKVKIIQNERFKELDIKQEEV